MKVIIAGALLFVAVVSVVALRDRTERVPIPIPTAITKGAAPAQVAPTGPMPEREAAPSNLRAITSAEVRPSTRLVADFKASKDWRAFAMSARSRPEEGGYFYAMYVANLCGTGVASMPHLARESISNRVAETGTVNSAQIVMTEKFMSRCASFARNEAADLYRDTKQASADNRDPILNALGRVAAALSTKDAQLIRPALAELLALGDPLAPYKDDLLVRVTSRSTEVKNPGDVWFDGNMYGIDDLNRFSTFRLALSLAACSAQEPCEMDLHMMLACLGGQNCAQSREEYLRQQYVNQGSMTEEQYAHAVSLSSRIRQVVANREVEALVR